MKARLTGWVMLATLVIGAVLGSARPSVAAGERALWVWDEPDAAVVDFAISRDVTHLYLHTPPGFSAGDAYRPFLAAAHDQGLTVLAMAGDPSWAADHTDWTAWMDEVVAFGDFDGAVFDVEPYTLPEWTTKRRGRLIRSYLEGLSEASLRAGSLDVYAAIPFWWDDPEFRTGRDLLLDRVLESVNGVVVMAYRDHASGVDGIIDVAATEAHRAAETGRSFVIAVETAPTDLNKVSFAEEGLSVMHEELSIVESHFAATAGFAGIAIHHFDSYASLLP
jgi:hypothetical protein